MADAAKSSGFEVRKSEEEWRAELRPQEYHVLREKGTERAYTGEYDKFYPAADEGYFACRACKNPLYTAAAKFDSGCGWPAFDKCIKDSMVVEVDTSFGMKRVEIMCAKCGGHLGHVFHGEGLTPTNERHCVNSVSVKFMKGPVPSSSEEQDGEENDGETSSGPAEEVLKDSKM
ncbi:Peptide methionine sulfoxide reductase B5 [Hondaea fermentalgiana]|uniref:Peptide-methionine (R)-S-oxide reductase n=1 Tax=Hondaea fermentalgiana TaxID=2315210 RepID=A0A2R5GP06_9STRA|nr:Peptide methionine sulfoxide reductase B5 [Hondaea fermentalgiana]|eukprot:GBG30041.1 Peptide methionine sulfoxide reductase B5 [Hondaea fermentalgiana]